MFVWQLFLQEMSGGYMHQASVIQAVGVLIFTSWREGIKTKQRATHCVNSHHKNKELSESRWPSACKRIINIVIWLFSWVFRSSLFFERVALPKMFFAYLHPATSFGQFALKARLQQSSCTRQNDRASSEHRLWLRTADIKVCWHCAWRK